MTALFFSIQDINPSFMFFFLYYYIFDNFKILYKILENKFISLLIFNDFRFPPNYLSSIKQVLILNYFLIILCTKANSKPKGNNMDQHNFFQANFLFRKSLFQKKQKTKTCLANSIWIWRVISKRGTAWV